MIDQFLITTGLFQSALLHLVTKLIRAELNLARSDNSFQVEFAVSQMTDGGFCSLSCLWGDLEDRWGDSQRFPLNIVYQSFSAATVQILRMLCLSCLTLTQRNLNQGAYVPVIFIFIINVLLKRKKHSRCVRIVILGMLRMNQCPLLEFGWRLLLSFPSLSSRFFTLHVPKTSTALSLEIMAGLTRQRLIEGSVLCFY